MVLRGTLLIPDALLPLFIFEERYREMLQFSLHADRIFCVALLKAGIAEPRNESDFFHVAGLGLIRACVTNKDGTSHLILHGIARVELRDFVQESPFYIAEIRELPTKNPDLEETRVLSARVIELCLQLKAKEFELAPEIEKQLPQLSNPEVLSNVVTNTFIHDPYRQQEVLQENVIAQRLRLLLKYLKPE
jgi:ATP-dependent Lon protease